jgi:transcriptional regulator with XRE-family HTH domain
MNREKFIENLKSAREERSLTQKQVAEALGVSDRTYSKWETGETEPGIELLCRLGDYYGMDPATFLMDAGDEPDLRRELASLPLDQAAKKCSERIGELYLGMFDSGAKENKPIAPFKAEQPTNSFSEYSGGLLFLQHLNRDANIQLYMMPSEEGFGWLASEGEALTALLDLLRQPKLLLPLLEPVRDGKMDYYTVENLAQRAGLAPEETKAALETLEKWGFCRHMDARTAESRDGLYIGAETRLLRAMLTLARLLLDYMPREGGETA